MDNYIFSVHAEEMLAERNILRDWVELAIMEPDQVIKGSDNN
jgi:hypothetical protein